MRKVILLLLITLLLGSTPGLQAANDHPKLSSAQLQQVWSEFKSTSQKCGQNETKTLFGKLDGIGPKIPVIEKLRQMEAKFGKTPEYDGYKSIETGIMRSIFSAADSARTQAWINLNSKPGQMRKYYGMGDIGSWVNPSAVDFSMDVDFTAFAIQSGGKTPTSYDTEFANEFGKLLGLTPIDFDVVVTTSGNEARAGVFVSNGGQKYAMSDMKISSIEVKNGKVIPHRVDSAEITYHKLIAEMKNDSRMSVFFEDPGNPVNLKNMSQTEANAFSKAMEKFYPEALDYLKFTAIDTSPAIQDFSLQLWDHVIQDQELSQRTRVKRAAKYAARGSKALRRGMAQLRAKGIDPSSLLTPEMKQVADLATKLDQLRGTDQKAYEKTLQDHFGRPPNADKVNKFVDAADSLLKTQMDLAHKASMLDILYIKGGDEGGKRTRALEDALKQYKQIEEQAGNLKNKEMLKKNRAMIVEVEDLLQKQKAGDLEGIGKALVELEGIVKTPKSKRAGLLRFLDATDAGKVLAKPLRVFMDEGGAYFKHQASTLPGSTLKGIKVLMAIPVQTVQEEIQQKGATLVALDYMTLASQCLQKYTDAVHTDANAAMAITEVIGFEVISRKIPFFSLIYGGWGAAQAGDIKQISKMFIYFLAPPAMIPDLLKGIGDMTISASQTWIFDDQLESLYQAAVFEPANGKEPASWNKVSDAGGSIKYTYKYFKSTKDTYDGVEGLKEFFLRVLNGIDIGTAYKAGGSEMQTGVTLLKNLTVKPSLLAMTVEGKHLLFHRDEGLKQLLVALTEIDRELSKFELNPHPRFKHSANSLDFGIVLNPTRDSLQDEGRLKVVVSGKKTSYQSHIEGLIKKRVETRDKLLMRLAEAAVKTFEARKRAEFLVKKKILKQTVYEQLVDAAKVLHVEYKLLGAIENKVSEQLAELGEKDKGKIQFMVNKWVNTYNQLATWRKELIQLGISLGVNKGYLKGPKGPLANTPPLQLDPDKDMKMGQKAVKDFGAIAEQNKIMLNKITAANAQKLGLDKNAVKQLIRIRFEAMVLEYWFRGPEGASKRTWTEFTDWPETDEDFLAKVNATIDDWKSWHQKYWPDKAQPNDAKYKIKIMDLAKEYNQLRNEIWVNTQLSVKPAPSPFVLQPGEKGTMGLIPTHGKASIKWRLNRNPDGVKVIGLQSGTFVPGKTVSQLLEIQAGSTTKPGTYTIELLLSLVKENKPLKVSVPGTKMVGTRVVKIPITIGEPALSTLTVKVLGRLKDKDTDSPVTGADVKLSHGQQSTTLTESKPGIYRAHDLPKGSYRVYASKNGESAQENWEVANEADSTFIIYLPVKQEEEKHAVTLNVRDKSDQSPLDSVQISITHPDKHVTRHKTQSGKVEVPLPPGAYMFSLEKDGYKERITRKNSTGSGMLTFEMASTKTIFASTQQKFLKFAVNPTSITMRSGEQRSISATALMMKGPAVVPKNVSTEATWTSKNPKLIAVSDGIIKSLGGSGVAEVEASYSPDPKLPAMTATCTVRIEEKAPDLPGVSIEVMPDKRTYEPGEALTFKIISDDPTGPWEYAWYMGDSERKGQQTTFTFMDSGKYTVTAIIRSTIDPSIEGAIRKSIEIGRKQPSLSGAGISVSPGPPYIAPADVEIELKGAAGEWIQWRINGQDVRRGEGKWAWTFKEKGTHTIKATYWQTDPVKSFSKKITIGGQAASGPIASQINRFDLAQEKDKCQVRSSYWREQDTGFGDWTKFIDYAYLGSCRNAIIATGDQSNGYNAGWVIFVPTGKNEVHFEVYGFNFRDHSVAYNYRGTFDLHNKTINPESLQFTEVHANEVIVDWQGTDGSLGRVRIHKYDGTVNLKNSGMHEIAFTEPRKKVEEAPAGFEKIGPGLFVYFDEKTYLTHVKVAPPLEYVLVQVLLMFRQGKDFDGIIDRKGILKPYSSYKDHEDRVIRLDQGTYTLPSPGQADVELYGIIGIKNYFWGPDGRPFRPSPALAGKSPVPIALSSSSGASTTGTRPIISEVVFKSSRWPIRLQDGVLEIQGERTGHYPWRKEWKQLGTGVETFNKFGTREGPLVVFRAKDRWHAVILNYASGQRKKEYSSGKEIEILRSLTYGAVLSIDERCYEFTPNKKAMAEVDCDSGRYIGKGL